MHLYHPYQLVGTMALHRRIDDVCRRAHERCGAHAVIAAISDIDDCVLDSGGRTVAILKEGLPRWMPSEEERAAAGRRLDAMVRRRGLPYLVVDAWEELVGSKDSRSQEVAAYWRERFFRNDWLAHDLAVQGAAAFLADVQQFHNMPVGYLTGRHEPEPDGPFPEGMRAGTEHSLREHRFPCHSLAMKPTFSERDLAFKERWFAETEVLPVVYFDNEPLLVNAHCAAMHRRGVPALSVFVQTTCLKPAALSSDALALTSFVN